MDANREDPASRLPIDSYVRAWRRYRTWRRGLWLGVLTAAASVSLGIWLQPRHSLGVQLALVVPTVAGLAAAVISLLGIIWFRCPRCGDPFSIDTASFLPMLHALHRDCINCGLPRWADHDPPLLRPAQRAPHRSGGKVLFREWYEGGSPCTAEAEGRST